MVGGRILIVSDNPELRAALQDSVTRAGLLAEFSTVSALWQRPALPESLRGVVLDTTEGTLAERAHILAFATLCASLPVLVIIAAGDVPTAVQAIRNGAREVLQKPKPPSVIVERILALCPIENREP